MSRTIAIIGAGQIGFASAHEFRDDGWDVSVLARSKPDWTVEGVEFVPHILGETPSPGADVVLDTIAFDEEDAARYDAGRVGRYIAVSSAAVYRDMEGRTFDTAGITGFPDFGYPIQEDASTIAGGPQSYSTKKIRMERKARAVFGDRSTVLRPAAIHGPWSRHAREWWFVKRLKDRRSTIPLAFDGASVFHTTSAQTLARLAVFLAQEELGGLYNVADLNAPSVKQIGQTIAAQYGKRVRFYGIEGPPKGTLGRTPWSLPVPFELDMSKAYAAGFEPLLGLATYEETVGELIQWLRTLTDDTWRAALTQIAAYPYDQFDYETEDRFFDERL